MQPRRPERSSAMSIHPTAIIHPAARLGRNVTVAPYAIIDEHVTIGDDTQIGAHATITGWTTLGRANEVHMGAVIGHAPQDRAFKNEGASYVVIGDRNIIREHATIHRPTKLGQTTSVGDDCYLMVNAHLAHDCKVGNGVIICNNSAAAGYVELADKVFVSGNVVLHQFSRVGTLAMLGGECGVGQDVPPFCTIAGRSQIRSLNVVGMRRAGIGSEARLAVKTAYKRIFAARSDFAAALRTLDDAPDLPEIRTIRAFYAAPTKRGFCWPPKGKDDIDDGRER
jgi:UDP-N-acetylglucosamine acyltransferase